MTEQDMNTRPSRDKYFMDLAKTVAERSTCDRWRIGCVIAKDNQILVTGYVWSIPGFPHCDEVGHQFKQVTHEDGSVTTHCTRTIHAEQNALCQAAKRGISLEWATVYCKMTPCRTCAMLLISSGVKRIVCEKKYHAWKESEEMFSTLHIPIVYFDTSVEKYEKQ